MQESQKFKANILKAINDIKLDDKQNDILNKIASSHILNNLNHKNIFAQAIDAIFAKNNPEVGIYLHGGVGVGKTMIMQGVFNAIPTDKKVIMHFQSFMNSNHEALHNIRKEKQSEYIIKSLVDQILPSGSILFLDEFEVKDISDAMLIMNIFRGLIENDIFIFITTNNAPRDLYKDGLQREHFLPCIDLIENKFLNLHLSTQCDYREKNYKNITQHFFYPLNDLNNEKINKIIESYVDAELKPCNITLFGRQLGFKQAYNRILVTDFDELINRDLGYLDYIAICKEFDMIFVLNLRAIDDSESNLITRFINFIDNVYYNNIQLYMSLECDIAAIYPKGSQAMPFKRTISRLKHLEYL